jgi:hypothetical protein
MLINGDVQGVAKGIQEQVWGTSIAQYHPKLYSKNL